MLWNARQHNTSTGRVEWLAVTKSNPSYSTFLGCFGPSLGSVWNSVSYSLGTHVACTRGTLPDVCTSYGTGGTLPDVCTSYGTGGTLPDVCASYGTGGTLPDVCTSYGTGGTLPDVCTSYGTGGTLPDVCTSYGTGGTLPDVCTSYGTGTKIALRLPCLVTFVSLYPPTLIWCTRYSRYIIALLCHYT